MVCRIAVSQKCEIDVSSRDLFIFIIGIRSAIIGVFLLVEVTSVKLFAVICAWICKSTHVLMVNWCLRFGLRTVSISTTARLGLCRLGKWGSSLQRPSLFLSSLHPRNTCRVAS